MGLSSRKSGNIDNRCSFLAWWVTSPCDRILRAIKDLNFEASDETVGRLIFETLHGAATAFGWLLSAKIWTLFPDLMLTLCIFFSYALLAISIHRYIQRKTWLGEIITNDFLCPPACLSKMLRWVKSLRKYTIIIATIIWLFTTDGFVWLLSF